MQTTSAASQRLQGSCLTPLQCHILMCSTRTQNAIGFLEARKLNLAVEVILALGTVYRYYERIGSIGSVGTRVTDEDVTE